jgi:hypothetical protein
MSAEVLVLLALPSSASGNALAKYRGALPSYAVPPLQLYSGRCKSSLYWGGRLPLVTVMVTQLPTVHSQCRQEPYRRFRPRMWRVAVTIWSVLFNSDMFTQSDRKSPGFLRGFWLQYSLASVRMMPCISHARWAATKLTSSRIIAID